MKKIVMVRSYYPDTRVEKEAEALLRSGYEVLLIVWDRGRSNKPIENKNIVLRKIKFKVMPGSIKVAFFLPVWLMFIIINLIKERWDFAHAADFDTIIPTLIVSKIKRKPITYDIYDFYADCIKFPIFPSTCRYITIIIDRFIMNFVDVIVIPDEARRAQIGAKAAKRVEIIQNSPSEDILEGIVGERNRKDKRFIVFFGGNVTEDRCLLNICLAVSDLPDVDFIIKGPCSEEYKRKLEQASKDKTNIHLYLDWAQYRDIIQNSLSSDAILAFYDPSAFPNNKYACPNKLFEAMLCAKPIITNDGTSMADIVRKEKCGIIVSKDVESIKAALIQLKDNEGLAKQLGENGRRAYDKKYNWRLMEDRLLKIYNDLDKKLK